MKTAHLILAHKAPQQVERMIKRLMHPNFHFYIHLDKKVKIDSFLYLASLPNVFFVKKRVTVQWAGFSQIQATFNGIEQICSNDQKYNFINLLTGQDYPIKPVKAILQFFEMNQGKEFISYRDILGDWKEAQGRYKKFHLTDLKFKGSTRIESLINGLFPERKMPNNLHPYGGSSYWMLSPEVAMYVVARFKQDRSLRKFFYWSWGSDEVIFQTILLNSPHIHAVVRNNYRYIDWSEKGSNPKILTTEDFNTLKDSPMLFARKFDPLNDSQVLTMIDDQLL